MRQGRVSDVRQPASLQCGRIVIVARLEVLIPYDLNAFFGFDAFEDDIWINAFSNGCVARGLIIYVQPVWVDRFPISFIIKAIKPVLQILSVFKLLHTFSLPQLGFGHEEKSADQSTWMAQRHSTSCLHEYAEYERSSVCLLR